MAARVRIVMQRIVTHGGARMKKGGLGRPRHFVTACSDHSE
jgi:hypothetical protein